MEAWSAKARRFLSLLVEHVAIEKVLVEQVVAEKIVVEKVAVEKVAVEKYRLILQIMGWASWAFWVSSTRVSEWVSCYPRIVIPKLPSGRFLFPR